MQVINTFITNSFRILKPYIKRAVELLYPPCCPFCDSKLEHMEKQAGICRKCHPKLIYITNNHCMKCGKPLASERSEYCDDCIRHKHDYIQARALLSYQKQTREAMYRFKYHNRREYAGFFAKEMNSVLGRWIRHCKADCLIPIPLYAKKEGERVQSG